jgi:hypothetical protein
VKYNIILKPKKYFLGFLLATILSKYINTLSLTTIEEYIVAIKKLIFPTIAIYLKYYIGLTN